MSSRSCWRDIPTGQPWRAASSRKLRSAASCSIRAWCPCPRRLSGRPLCESGRMPRQPAARPDSLQYPRKRSALTLVENGWADAMFAGQAIDRRPARRRRRSGEGAAKMAARYAPCQRLRCRRPGQALARRARGWHAILDRPGGATQNCPTAGDSRRGPVNPSSRGCHGFGLRCRRLHWPCKLSAGPFDAFGCARRGTGLFCVSGGGRALPKSGCPGAKVGGTTVIICLADQTPKCSLPGK
jgi:hypothetical protein